MIIGQIFPNQWWPVVNGADARHLQIRQAVQGLGHQVIALSNSNKKRLWNHQGLDHFRLAMGEIILFNNNTELRSIIKNRNIDVLLVDYIDTSIQYQIGDLDIEKVLFIHDIGSHNYQYEEYLKPKLSAGDFSLDDIELSIFDHEVAELKKFDKIVTIAQHETDSLAKIGIETVVLPYQPPIRPIKNTYEQYPLTLCGQSIVNLHGLKWFEQVFGARLFSRMPDVRVDVVGPIHEWIVLNYKFHMHGILENLDKILKGARFGIAPILFGTGQKIKILEMMGASLPVIAYKTRSAECPLDNTCGLLSDNIDEWLDMFRQLWLDRKKCRQMGEIAQQKAASWFPIDKQLEILSTVL